MTGDIGTRDGDAGAVAGSRAALPVLLLGSIVLLLAAAFAVTARRGFDLTDEGFYLLSFRHWNEVPAFSYFAAYLQFPYQLLGESLWLLRLFGFLLLTGSAIWCMRELDVTLHRSPDVDRGLATAAALAGGTAVWSYYGASPVPYTPSYNLLALASALLSTAITLRLGRTLRERAGGRIAPASFALGLVAAVGIACKFSTGVLVLGSNVLLLVILAGRVDRRTAVKVLAMAMAGGVVNVAGLLLLDHDLLARFQRGLALQWALLPRRPLAELSAFAFAELPLAIAQAARILLWPFVLTLAILAAASRLTNRWKQPAISAGVVLLCVGASVDIFVKDNRHLRILLLTLLALFIALAAAWLNRGSLVSRGRQHAVPIWVLVACMPFAYSFGTNNSLVGHMGMAAVFPTMLAVAGLRSMQISGAITPWAFLLSLALLAASPGEIVVRQWFDGNYTYRLGAALREQAVPLPGNAAGVDVAVDHRLAETVEEFLAMARRAGFRPGRPLIDFTGQSPGLVALAGGVPVGAMWLVGGPLFAGDKAAALALADVDSRLRGSWILSSDDSFARIATWQEILKHRGGFDHDSIGSLVLSDPSSSDKSKRITVFLWRPRSELP